MSGEFQIYSAVHDLLKSLHATSTKKVQISQEELSDQLKTRINDPNVATQVKVAQTVRSLTESSTNPHLFTQTYQSTAARVRDSRTLNNVLIVLQGLKNSPDSCRILARYSKQDDGSLKIGQILNKETRKTELIIQAQEKAMSPKVKYTGDQIRQLTAELSKVTQNSDYYENSSTPNLGKVRRSIKMDDFTGHSGLKISESVPNLKMPRTPTQNNQNLQNIQNIQNSPIFTQNHTPNPLQTSKSNIFDQSEETNSSNTKTRPSTKIVIPDWVTKRAHSSMTLIPSINKAEQLKLGTLPLYEQEYELVKDLLCIFIGVAGRWVNVRVDPENGQRRIFQVDDSVEPGLRLATEKLLPLGMAYHRVSHFTNNVAWLPKSGQTLNALAAAIRMCLNDHRLAINTIYNQHIHSHIQSTNCINLQRLHAIVTGPNGIFRNMQLLQNIASSLESGGQKGAAVLSWLSDRASDTGDLMVESLYQSLMSFAEKPYFETLERWLVKGVINNSDFIMGDNEEARKEFFVAENSYFSHDKLKTDYHDQFWERRFRAIEAKCPVHLVDYKDKILKTGKYVRVINECLKQKPLPTGEIHEWQPPPTQFPYSTIYEEIEAYYSAASKQLLNILVKEHGLYDQIKAVRRYLLFGDLGSDAISHLLSIAHAELHTSASSISKTALNESLDTSLVGSSIAAGHTSKDNQSERYRQINISKIGRIFELSLRSTLAAKDPFNESICVDLKTVDYITEIGQVLSMNTSIENRLPGTKKTEKINSLSVIDVFCLNFDANWPNNIVLSKKNLTHYQMIFRHLLYCKVVEHKLVGVWHSCTANCKQKSKVSGYGFAGIVGNRGVSKTDYHILSVCRAMLSFVRSFKYYMSNEVVQPYWADFEDNLTKVEDLDQVLEFQAKFLDSVMKDCLLSNRTLLCMMSQLLDTCQEFAKAMVKVLPKNYENKENFGEMGMNSDMETGDLESGIDSEKTSEEITRLQRKFEKYLAELLAELTKLSSRTADNALFGLALKLNYNEFYSN